eukprot:Sspe_Gene.80377::Locus_50728_Transcript_1_1_Confidence_1.000_Length_550::g.80377::m.80377
MFRRTAARMHFLEKIRPFNYHPYAHPLVPGESLWPIPPFSLRHGVRPAFILFVLYVIWDRFLGPSAGKHHHHNKWQNGIIGARPGMTMGNTSYGYNYGGGLAMSWGTFEHGKESIMKRASPFYEERYRKAPSHDDHGHH